MSWSMSRCSAGSGGDSSPARGDLRVAVSGRRPGPLRGGLCAPCRRAFLRLLARPNATSRESATRQPYSRRRAGQRTNAGPTRAARQKLRSAQAGTLGRAVLRPPVPTQHGVDGAARAASLGAPPPEKYLAHEEIAKLWPVEHYGTALDLAAVEGLVTADAGPAGYGRHRVRGGQPPSDAVPASIVAARLPRASAIDMWISR
jgi:hypothetical protein